MTEAQWLEWIDQRAWDTIVATPLDDRSVEGFAASAWAHALAFDHLGRSEEAQGALRQALTWRPYWPEAWMMALSLAERHGEGARAREAAQRLYVHHAPQLAASVQASLHRRLAEAATDPASRRVHLALAFSLAPAWTGAGMDLLRAKEGAGDQLASRRLRATLLRHTKDNSVKASLLWSQAEEAAHREDYEVALRFALECWHTDPNALRWEQVRTWLAYATSPTLELAMVEATCLGTERSRRPEHYQRLEHLVSQDSGLAPQALRIFEAVLDHDPLDLKAFERLTVLLGASRDWRALEEAYRRMIRRLQAQPADGSTRALAQLWRNLGELCRTQLGEVRQAVFAYRMSYQLHPDPATEQLLVRTATELPDAREALDDLEAAFSQQPGRADLAEELGLALLKAGAKDRGALLLRVAVAHGATTARTRQALDVLERQRRDPMDHPLTEQLRQRFLRVEAEDEALEQAMTLAYHGAADRYFTELDTYGVSRRDRLNTSEDTMLARLWQRSAALYGYKRAPEAYLFDKLRGVVDAFCEVPTFLLHQSLVQGWSEPELRFVIVRGLTLATPRFALVGRLSTAQLRAVLGALCLAADPRAPIEPRPSVVELARHIQKALSPSQRAALDALAPALKGSDLFARIDGWAVRVADEANRTALYYADQPAAAARALERITPSAGRASLGRRVEHLLVWAASRSWHDLRRATGAAFT